MSYLEPPLPQVSKAANYSILLSDRTILVDTSGGGFTLTLPDPTKAKGIEFRIYDSTGFLSSTNPLTLARFAAEKIEGLAASKLFQTAWGGWSITSNGVDWFVK